MNPYLSTFVPLVDFLGESLGDNTEVVLHDLTDYHQSVVAIHNGHISGRGIGSPITDLSLQVLKTASFDQAPYLSNYQSVGRDGQILKSCTYFIKDEQSRCVGMLCINTDYHELLTARNLLSGLAASLKIPNESAAITENLNMSVHDLVLTNLQRICPDLEIRADSMQQKEKMELVDKLNEMGTFLIKGAIGYVAEALRVSVPTIYRYLNMLKKEA